MKKKPRTLFDTYSNNLDHLIDSRFLRITKNRDFSIYICPLCKRIFSDSMTYIKDENISLTIEHSPPKSVGSYCLTLTCNICNSEHGSRLDSQLKKSVDYKSIIQGNTPFEIPIESTINKYIQTNGLLSRDKNGTVDFFFDGKRTNPIFEKELIKLIKDIKNTEINIKIRLEPFNKNKVNLSLVRSAYLILFERFGYSFIFTKSADLVRRKICDTVTQDYLPLVIQDKFTNSQQGIYFIYKPKELMSFLVVLRLTTNEKSFTYGVLFPNPLDDHLRLLEYISSKKNSNGKLKFNYLPIPDINYLKKENILSIFHLQDYFKHVDS